MLVSGVRPSKAKIMYFAVRWRGPRWEERVTLNTTLPVGNRFDLFRLGSAPSEMFSVTMETIASPGEQLPDNKQLEIMKGIKTKIESDDYSLDQLDALAEESCS
jgi:hypothetical protein